MSVTYNNVVDAIKYFADNHAQINSFGYGDFKKIGGNETQYPLLFVHPITSTLKNQTAELSFYILAMDLVNADLTNEQDIHSDMLQVLKDLKTYLNSNSFNGWYVEDIGDIDPFSERFIDYVGGWNFKLTVVAEMSTGCSIPGIDSTFVAPTTGCPECEECADCSTDFDTEAPFTYSQEGELWTEHETSWSYEGSSEQYLQLHYTTLEEGWYLFEITLEVNTNGLTLSGFNGQTFDVSSAGILKFVVYNTETDNSWFMRPLNANALVSFQKSSVRFRRFL
jgi:hypothetical protein